MKVGEHLAAAFALAFSRSPNIHDAWIKVSLRVGSVLNQSILTISLQELGRLDMVLRCLEDDFSPNMLGDNDLSVILPSIQLHFSEIWMGSTYEIFRLLQDKKRRDEVIKCYPHIGVNSTDFSAIFHDLAIVRIPIEKHEIEKDNLLQEAIKLETQEADDAPKRYSTYDNQDPLKGIIIPRRTSNRGSIMWCPIEVVKNQPPRSKWIERRDISDRVLALWGSREVCRFPFGMRQSVSHFL